MATLLNAAIHLSLNQPIRDLANESARASSAAVINIHICISLIELNTDRRDESKKIYLDGGRGL